MKNDIKYYYEFIKDIKKRSIKELEALLKSNSKEDRETFIISFLPYVFRISYKLYLIHKEWFNDNYSYDDFFQDAVIIVENLYDSRKFCTSKDNFENFNNFIYFFRFYLLSQIRFTYFRRINYPDLKKTHLVNNASQDYFDKYSHSPTIKELSEMTGVSSSFIKKIIQLENYDDLKMLIVYEDNILEKIDLQEVLQQLTEKQQRYLCQIYGISINGQVFSPKKSIEIAKEEQVTHQNVTNVCNAAYKKIKQYVNY